MERSLARQLKAEPPQLHAGGAECGGLHWAALEWLERTVQPGWSTLETGAGLSTMVFAARGSEHETVTPEEAEVARIVGECQARGISTDRVRFHVGPSHEVLAAWQPRPLDLVLLDGAHGFPYPILDWWHIAPRLKEGGRILLDDAYLPPVTAVLDHAERSPDWEVERTLGYRTVVVRKLRDALPPFDWDGGRIGGRLTFRYLRPAERPVASARHRLFSTRLGLAAVGLYHRRSGLRWRKKG